MRSLEPETKPATVAADPAVLDAQARLRETCAATVAATRGRDALHRQVVDEPDPIRQRQFGRQLNAFDSLLDETALAERSARAALAEVTATVRSRLLTHYEPERRALIRALDDALRAVEQHNRALLAFDRATSAAVGTEVATIWGSAAFAVGPCPEDGHPGSAIDGWRRSVAGWLR